MFGHIKSTPSASLNWKLITAISVLGFMGMSRGSDEGIISGVSSSKSWLQRFQVQDGSSAQSNVVSMVQLGSIPGSLLAFLVVDQLGRLRTSQICCLLWLVGNTVWITSPGSVGQVLAGRFVSGLGIGGFPVVCPTFLAEIAPATVRGAAVGAFSSSVYIAILIGYSVNYGVSLHYDDTDERIWKIPVAVNFIFAGLALMGTLAIRESPRWLLGKAREEEAIGNLCWYRGLPDDHPFIKEELEGIRTQTGMERQASELANKPGTTRLVELFSKSSNLYRLFVIGFGIQILGQWSGGGSLTIYAPKIINLVEKTSDTTLFTTCIFGVVKLVASLVCMIFLIDVIGRRRSVLLGISLQTLAALYLTIYLAILNPSEEGKDLSGGERRASIGAVAMIFLSGVAWALGFNAIQYLVGTEIFPIRVRATATSLIMAVHFSQQYGSSRALQPMLKAMDRWGLFALWTSVGVVAAIYILLLVPETAGRSLEEMEELFETPWRVVRTSVLKGRGRERVGEVEDVVVSRMEDEKAEKVDQVVIETR